MKRALPAIYSGMSTLSLTLIVLILGNVSIALNLNYEANLICYSALIYLISNWVGLHDLIIANYSFQQILPKVSIDFCVLIVLCLLLPRTSYLSEFDLYFTIAIYTYPIFVCIYLFKKNEYYATSLFVIITLHFINLYIIFRDVSQSEILVIFLSYYAFIVTLVLKIYGFNSFKIRNTAKRLNKADWILFAKIYITGVLFGEIDRYFLAYFIDAKVAILYVTLASILGAIPLFSASLMQYLVNRRKTDGMRFKFDKNLKLLFYSGVFVGIAATISLGYTLYAVVLLSVSLAFKYYYVIKTMVHVVEFYHLKSVESVYRLNLHQNVLGLLVNLMYFVLPAGAVITALSKFISTFPLVALDNRASKT